MRIDLFWIGSTGRSPPTWILGRTGLVANHPPQIAAAVAAREPGADFLLFWDAALGVPDESNITKVARLPGDVWHAGLALGMAGMPHLIDSVDPVWRFNRDPDPEIIATSWRLSLRACLARATVVDQLGGPDPHFESPAAASLELGHRWIWKGALMRHVAGLAPERHWTQDRPVIPLVDEFRFIRLGFGRMWAAWAAWRYWRRGGGLIETVRAWRRQQPCGVAMPGRFVHDPALAAAETTGANTALPSVSILIPTLDRYPHLFNLLSQLRQQSISPLEIVVIDQTEEAGRDANWPERFNDLPLRVLWRDRAGQSSSRNSGMQLVRGDAVLFLDDDDEVPPDLITRHVALMRRFNCDGSCGVAEEVGAEALPPAFGLIRDSDVFPTNNTLLITAALDGSGLFDLAFEKGERADHDLGMRLYLSGATLVLNPAASVVHLRAPRGGLRQHKARVVTRSSSRASLWGRHFLAPTEGYLWCRYYNSVQIREALLIRTLGNLRGSRRGASRMLRIGLMVALLPDTWRKNNANLAIGRGKLVNYPDIPNFMPASAEEIATL